MSIQQTLLEMFAHYDWARDQLLELSFALSDEQLDQSMEMGPGTVRAGLLHIHGAERGWLDLCLGNADPRWRTGESMRNMGKLGECFQTKASERDGFLRATCDAELDERRERPLANRESLHLSAVEMLMHVYNHGVHHRAQVMNMLRRLGAAVPGLDYLYYKIVAPSVLQEPGAIRQLREGGLTVGETEQAETPFNLDLLRRYFKQVDRAREKLSACVAGLDDAALDRPFEIGRGTLRKTLLHIHDAEAWWLDNWKNEPKPEFMSEPETTSLADLAEMHARTTDGREAYLDGLSDADLRKVTVAWATPTLKLNFRVGESLLQVCMHGTHHRAQALNMLRQLGREVVGLDMLD